MNNIAVLQPELNIDNRIFTIRGVQVMFDSHLAELYGVDVKRINEQVKRNLERFPDTFMFQLSEAEWEYLKYQVVDTKPSKKKYFSKVAICDLRETKGKTQKISSLCFYGAGSCYVISST